jgi:Flp pilus assembly protein TadB
MAGHNKPEKTAAEKKAQRSNDRVRQNQTRRTLREKQNMEKWAQQRKKGMMNYVIKNGLIAWTLMTSVIYVLLLGVTYKFKFSPEMLSQIAIAILFFAIGGVLFGFATWYVSESKFKRSQLEALKKKEDRKSKPESASKKG